MRSAVFIMATLTASFGCGDTSSVSTPPPPPPSIPMADHQEWLWVGPQGEAPACPGDRQVDWEGWAHETATGDCGACECGPAACVPPSSVTAYASTCRIDDEGVRVTFDAGEGSDGSCVAAVPPVSSNTFASVIFEPPTLAPCTPSQPLEPPPISMKFARACPSSLDEVPPSGFSLCTDPELDGSCRPGFSDRRELTERFVDNRTCAPCACGEPTGGDCRVDVGLYGDASCVDYIVVMNWMGLGFSPCSDTPANLPLSTVRVVLRQQEPGACTPTPSISEVVGTVEQGEKRVFCCAQ